MNITLKLIGLFGLVLFGALFLVTFLSPETIEESAKGFVKVQVEKEIREKKQSISDATATEAALSLAEKLGFEKERIQSNLDNDLPDKIATIIASMCGYDCEKKKALSQSIASSYLDRIKNIQIAENTLSDVVKGKYIQIVSNVIADLRMFLGSNFAMFLVLLVVSFAKPNAIVHLFMPGLLLVVATIFSSSIYIFGQNWFYTILYNDYMGFGYLAYIAVIFGFLSDVIFNSAKVTTHVINGVANAIGSAFSVVSC